MPKISNGETPFSLAYDTEVVIPEEIGMPAKRTIQRTNEENDVELRLNLNLLEERRDIVIIREARRKQQVEKYYNMMGAYKLRTMDGKEVPRTWHSSNLRKYYM
ncbi:hypothetical protein Tco_1486147 [Tanacetum coccineum]